MSYISTELGHIEFAVMTTEEQPTTNIEAIEPTMTCCRCCTKADATCRKVMEPFLAILRVLENIPIIGHIISAIYGCSGCKDQAERAGIKATVGIGFASCNCPAEMIDEMVRHRSPKQLSFVMVPRPDWMKRFHQRTLRHICIPGSHQSPTYSMSKKLEEIPMVEGWSRCQDLSIDSQLYGGVRLLDLRVITYDRDVWTHHQKVICVKFRDILETVRDFITENPSEIVFLYITNDGKNVDWMSVHSLLNEYLGSRLIPEHMRDMKIGDIIQYGKNIVACGIPNVAYSWKGLDYHWPNKDNARALCEDMKAKIVSLRQYNPYFLFWYKAECTPSPATIVRGIGGLPGAIAAQCADEKFDFIEDMAAAINHCILRILNECDMMPFNVISTDYINTSIIERIIDMNRLELTGAGPMTQREVMEGSKSNLLLEVSVDQQDTSFDPSQGRLEVWESGV